MAKFKVGDRVIRTGANNMGIVKGNTYTVKEIYSDDKSIQVFGLSDWFQSFSFDLVSSSLPTDRPLTYDETQMLQAGDVVKTHDKHKNIQTITDVTKDSICFSDRISWDLNSFLKDTQGKIYFVSRPEAKEEKKEEVKGGFKTPAFIGVPIHAGNVWTTSTATGYDYGLSHKKMERAIDTLFEKRKETVIDASKLGITSLEIKSKEKSTKSVSQILYGR